MQKIFHSSRLSDFGREDLAIFRVILQPGINGPVVEEVVIISNEPFLAILAKLGHIVMPRGKTCRPCVKPGMKKAVPMVAIPCVGF